MNDIYDADLANVDCGGGCKADGGTDGSGGRHDSVDNNN